MGLCHRYLMLLILAFATSTVLSRKSRESLSTSLSDEDLLMRTLSVTDWPSFLATFYPETTRVLYKKPRKNRRRKSWKPLNSAFRKRKSFRRSSHVTKRPVAAKTRRPNVILMMADDQDVELGSLQFMPKLNKYLKSEGAHLENGYVTTPMCCPSRSSMLTGLYAHNHHVLTNNENCSSPYWIDNHESRTFATYMHDSGYKTGYFGKYLNKYTGQHIPSGWDEWSGLVRNSRFYNYTLNVNGKKVKHGFDYSTDYFPDLITNNSLSFFRKSKIHRPQQPVLMVMSYPGPHGPEDSAPQYQDLFFNVTTHHTPAYDYAPNPDKQWILQVTDRLDTVQKKFTDVLMTKRLQTLQSIDEAIERLYNEVKSLGELDNTYIFYTSDHGYHLGQFGLVKGKAFPFDVDTKVPFFVRGPGIEPGTVGLEPVLNIDLAPTFLDIAGLSAPLHMDGKSIMPTLKANLSDAEQETKAKWRHSFLLERGKMTVERYQKIQHNFPPEASNTTPWETKNEILLSGLSVDPVTDDLLLERSRVTKQERLAVECLKDKFQAPCGLFQRRKCVRRKNGNWKIVNCKNFDFSDLSNEDEECSCNETNHTSRSERKLQRDFLKKHTMNGNRQQRKMRHKFLNLDDSKDYDHWRSKRSAEITQSSPENQTETAAVASVLKELAEEEIDEVDIIMEDINDEIDDLQRSIANSSVVKKPQELDDKMMCEISKQTLDVNCSTELYTTPTRLRNSRAYINEQIRRLRSQLFELKEIRKHLKRKRPETSRKIARQSKSGRCVCANRKERRQRLKDARRSRRDRVKLERLQRRLRRKERRQLKKARKLRKERRKKRKEACLVEDEKMNCFTHDNDHWKTKPLWTDGSFCACTNSNTNTYWCVRNINITHNYLYCEFVSGIITYYNLNVDPYQLRNIYQTLSDAELNYMHQQLLELKDYSGFDGKWRPAKVPLENRRNMRRQKQFARRYGQLLPSPDAYKPRKSKNRTKHYNNSRRNRHQSWISVSITVSI